MDYFFLTLYTILPFNGSAFLGIPPCYLQGEGPPKTETRARGPCVPLHAHIIIIITTYHRNPRMI